MFEERVRPFWRGLGGGISSNSTLLARQPPGGTATHSQLLKQRATYSELGGARQECRCWRLGAGLEEEEEEEWAIAKEGTR